MAMSSKPKSFTFYTKATWRRKLVTWSMLFLYLTQPILASAEVVADPKAPKASTPQVQTTANGLPVVQIAAPSASGVSRNLYQQFNVDPSGIILNNSQLITQTQLAGYITGNPNLANGSARIILNEVTSNNPSYLRGYTEVAGQKAEVIIANPNGIYGDGFGFINTSRAVLTTGTPVFGGSGSLDTFRVTGGQISIQGNGMNASNTDQVDIISRAVNVNAGLYANQLNVVAGANQVNYNTLQAQPIAGDINTPQVQIDIGQLGGMYARKIYMVGTEKGVGVNSKGIISSIGDLAINSEGKVTLAQTSAGGNIAVTTKDQVTNQGSLYAQGSITINSQGDFQNTGILASGQQTSLIAQNISSTGSLGAGITSDGKVGNTGDLILNANGTVTTHGQNIIAGDLSIQGTALDLSGSQTTAGSNISLTATQGNINNTGGSIQTRNVLTVSVQGTIHNDQDTSGVQAQIGAGQLNLAAANITNQNSQITQTGIGDTSIIVNNTLDNTVGQIETNGTNTTIQAANIINSQGQIQHAGTGNLALQTISDLTNSSGKISTNGQVNFIAQNLDNTQGSITAQKQISVTSRVDVKNQHGTIMSADALNINAQGNVMNQQGDMEANKGLSITAQSFNNQSGRLVNLDGSNMKVNISHGIQNQSGLLGGNGNVNIVTQTLENQGGKITSQGNLAVNATNGIDSNLTEGQVLDNGAITSGGDLTLNSTGKVRLSGNTSANGKIQVNAQSGFANYGIVSGQNNTEINTQGALDNTGTILAGQHTTLTAQTVNSTGTVAAGVQDDGTLGNNGDLTVNTEGTVSLNGKNMAAGNLTVNGAALDLKNSKNIAGGAIKLTAAAGDIDHSSATLHTDKTVTAEAQGSIRNDKGNITAAQLTLTGGSISNRSGAMTQVGQGNTTITAANTIDNTSGAIATNGNAMEMQTASLINSQGQILHAGAGNLLVQASGDVRNDRGKLATNGQLTAAANTIDNTKGTVTGQQQVNLTTRADMINIQGTLTGSDTVNIKAQGAVNNQQGDIEANKGLSITAQSFNNQSGRLVNLDASNMKINVSHDIQNQSGLLGGNGNVNIVTQTLENQGGKITSQGNLAVNATNGIDSNLTEGQVLNNGAITSGGDLTLNSTGKVRLSGSTSANGKIQVNAQDGFANYGIVSGQNNTEINTQGALDNTGTILAGQHTTLTAQTVNSTGTVAAGVQDDGTLGNNGDLTVNAKGTVSLNGKNMAAGNLNVNGANLDLKNSKNIAGGAIKLTAAAGDIDHSSATLHTDKTVTAEAQGSIRNDKGNITAAQLTLTGGSISNRSGAMTQVGQGNTTITAANTIDNTSGTIATNGNAMEMQTASLINSQGQILHAGAGNLLVQASGDVRNDRGKLATNGQLTVAANTIDNTKGTVTGQQQVNLTTRADMINIQGKLTGSDTVNIKAQGAVNNQQGDIEASKGLELVAQSLDNQNGRLASLDASGLNINIAHDVKNQSGLIGGNGKVNITTQNISNQSGKMIAQDNLTITATNGIDNTTDIAQVQKNGGITSGGDLIVNSEGKVLLSGNTTAKGNIKINARGGLSNNSTMYAQGNTDISTQGTLENSSIIAAGQDTTLTVQNMTSTGTLIAGIQNDGTLGSSGDLMINAGGAVTNHGQNMAASNLTVNGTSLDLGNGKIYAGGNANLTATTGDIDHSGGALQVGGVFNANAKGVIRNDNGTISTGKLTLNANSISNRSGTMSQFGQEATTINAINTVDNTGGTLITNGDPLTIHAGSLINSQGQIQHAGKGTLSVETKTDYKNDNGKVATNGHLQLSAKNMDNTQGTILAKGIDLTANGTLKNSQGVIASSVDAIRINVQGNISNEQGSIEANKGLEVIGQSLDNQKGRIVSLDTSGLTITTAQDLQNQSGLIGGNGDIQLTASSFTNSLGQVIAQGSIHGDISQNIDNTNGNIKAQQGITLGQLSTKISNSMQGAISAGTNLAIKANAFDNTDGNLTAKQDIAIQAGDMTAGGTALAGQDVNLTVTNSFTQQAGGDLKANRDVTIVADTFLNKGSISAVKDINLQMNKAINDSGSKLVGSENLNVTATGDVVNLGMMAGNTTAIDAKNIANSGSIFTDKLAIKADTLSNTGNTAGITANQSAAFHVNTALHNINGATMYMGNKDTALTINTLALDNSGVIASRGNLAVEAQTIHSSGTLGAGVQSDGTLATDGDLVLQASDTVVATGKNLAAGTLAVTAQDINLTGAKTWAGNDISLTAFTGDINNTGAVMQAKGAITLQAANALHNDKDAAGNAANIQGNAITIHANAMSNVGSNMTQFGSADTNLTSATTLDNTDGSIVSNGTNLTIQTDTLTGSQSKIVHAGTSILDVKATTSISNTNGSSIQTNGNVAIKAGNIDNTKGIVTALQGIDVTGNTLENNQGTLAASKGVSITLQNGLKNQKGIVEAGKALTMNAQSIDNNGGSISSLDDSGITVNAVQNIDNTAGTIGSNGDINLTARSIVNTTGKVLSQGSINADTSQSINNTSGTIAARQNVTIGKTGTNIVNATQGSITAGGTLVAQANTLSNTGGTMAANSDVTITAATVNGTGTVTAGQDVNLTVNGDFTYSADSNVKANRDVNLTAANVNNLGNMAAVRNLAIHTNNVMNHATLQGGSGLTIHATDSISNDGTMEGNTANINAQSITNTGSVFGDTITMTADAISNNGKTAVIAATKNVNLYAKTSLENKDDATIYSMGNINIAGSNKQAENGEYIDQTGSILNQSATIEADGNIEIYADTLTNKMREYETKETIVSEKRYDQEDVFQANDTYELKFGDKNLYYIVAYRNWKNTSTATAKVLSGELSWPFKGPVLALLAETVTETAAIPKSSIGKIVSGKNIKLRVGTTNNDMAWILANGTLDQVGTINNTAVGNTRSITQQLIYLDDYYDQHKELVESDHNSGKYQVFHGQKYRQYFNALSPDGSHFGYVGKSYYQTTTEQLLGGASSLFGGGQQVIIQGGSVNNTTVAATSVPITVNNTTSSRVNQSTASIPINGSTNSQTVAIQAVSGYTAVTSTSVPIGNFQTLLPKAQNQSVTSAQTSGNSSNQTTTMPVNTAANITSSTQNQSVASAQTNGNLSSQTATMPVSTAGNITSSTQNQSVASAQINSSQATTVQTGSTTQTALSPGKTPGVVEVKQTVDDSKFTLPTNGMFSTSQEPNSKYLVETNPRFTSYSNFISSDYMLQQLNFDPAKTMKRLGDGFYEQKLVREQVTDLTGRYFLNDYSSAEDQYKALMTNGAAYAKQFNLQVGIALTTEQMAQLTSNMVWMVEKDVDGQKVLVPEVYLARSGNIILKADGAVIAADNIQITASGDVNNAGTIKATESVNIQAVNIANYGGTIDGGKSTQLTAGQNIVNFGGSINGDHTQLVAGKDVKNETISFTSTLPFMTKTTIGNVASINAGDSLTINANDTSIIGAELNAGQNVTINATGNFIVDSIQEQDRLAAGKYLKDTVSNVVSSINAGNNVSITSTGDATLKGAQITAGNALDLTAGGNINITAVKDETIQDKTVGSSNNWKRTRTDDETVIGSTLQGGGKVTVKTTAKLSDETTVTDSENRGNITIAGSTIKSKNDKVTISADKNATIEDLTEKHESLVVTHKKKSGFLSSKTTDTMDHSLINEVKGSTISGDTVTISSGSDLTVQGSNVVGTKDVTLNATKDVNITSATETGADDHYSYIKKSGLFNGGGLGFTIGSQSTKTTTNERTLGEVGSTIGSINGDVSITAGEKVNSEGTTFVSGNDLNITGKDVNIDNTINTYDSQTKYEFKQTGLSVSLGGGIVKTATSAYNNIERSGQVQDERLQALYDYKAYKDLKDLKKTLDGGLTKENLEKGVSINVSIGSTKMTSTDTVHTETVNTSNINAGGDVNITATTGDVNLKGTKINAEDITLDAKDNINIESAENKLQTTNNTSFSSTSIGAFFGLATGAFGGLSGSFNSSKGHENENSMANVGSIIDASGTLTLNSGKDTNIIGSQVKGDTVVADIDGNLNIVSKQDTDDYTSKNQSSGFGVSTGPKGGITGSLSKGKTDSNYASVTEQAGIYAREGGFDINVGKNTDLKGAVIASEATPDKNKISTDTLTYSDIQNKAEYDSSSIGVNVNTTKDAKYNEKGVTPNIGVTAKGDEDSTTKSAISPGTIEVRSNPNQNLSNLSRDTDNSLNVLDKIFDKKTVQEQQELANLFGELAFEEVHKISKANGWDEGSPQKIALHAFVGAIMADLGGGNALSGAVGAGLNEAVQKELKEKFKDNPDMHQWASAIIGSAAATVVGGDAQTGASTAASGTKNNFLSDWQKEQREQALKDEDWEKVAYWDAIDKAQDQAITYLGLYPGIDLNAPKNSGILEAVSKLGQEIEASPDFQGSFLSNAPTVDSSTLIAAGAAAIVVAGVTLYYYDRGWVKAGTVASGSGAWGQATFQSEKLLERHIADHLHEFGNITQAQYVQKARDLLNSKVGGEVQGFTNNLGWTFRYNATTNEFAIGSPQGTISTMMRPTNGMQYWLEQVEKYGNL
jgi:filamentous hemagglutinin